MVSGATMRHHLTLTTLVGTLFIVACGGQPNNDPLLCKVALNHMMYEPNEDGHAVQDEFYACHPVKSSGAVSGQMFMLDLPDHIGIADRDRVHDGEDVFLSIPGGTLSLAAVRVPNATAVKVVDLPEEAGRRKLRTFPAKQGELTLLPIRIITRDSEPDFSADRLHELLFDDEVSLNKQMRQCSFGKFGFLPTKYGVLEVPVDLDASGTLYNVVSNAASLASLDLVTEDVEDIRQVADLIMFIVPPGTLGGWAAFGNVNGVATVFNNRWAGYPAAEMHEIGHNLGLFHANENGSEYTDVTGVMGAAPDVTDYPQRCFNAQNFWHLGWYEDRSIEVDPETPTLLKIAAFVDYNKTISNEYVGVKVRDLYIQYNRATAFNKETGEKQNMLTVVREESRGTDLIASLDARTPFSRIPLDDGLLVIEVCNIVSGTSISPDTMLVSIGFGVSQCPPEPNDCPGFGLLNCAPPITQPPVPAPTRAPTSEKPSMRPVLSSTQYIKRSPPPAARPTDTVSNIFARVPTAPPSTTTTETSPSTTETSPSPPSVPSTPSGSTPNETSTSTPVAPPQPTVSSVQGGQSSSSQQKRKLSLAFIVIAITVFVAVWICLGCYIRHCCLQKKVYRDVTGFDEEEQSLSSKDIAETDSSISSESSPSPPLEEFIVTGVVARPIGTRAGDAWQWYTASRKPQTTQPVTPVPRDQENSFGGGSMRVIGSVAETAGGSRSRNMSPVSPVPSDHASARSHYHLSSTPTRSPARRRGNYLDDGLHDRIDRDNRMLTRPGYSSGYDAPRTTDLRRSMASAQGAIFPHRASSAASSLYYDERVQRNIETPQAGPVSPRMNQSLVQRSRASPEDAARPHSTSPAVRSNIDPPPLESVAIRLQQTWAQLSDFNPYGESENLSAGGRRRDQSEPFFS